MPKVSVVAMVEKLGINVNFDDFIDPSVIVFDFEVVFEKTDKSFSHNAEKLFFTHRHSIFSGSSFEREGIKRGKVFVNSDPKKLVEKFICYCLDAGFAAQSVFRQRTKYIFKALRKMEIECEIASNYTLHAQIQKTEKRLNSNINKTPWLALTHQPMT